MNAQYKTQSIHNNVKKYTNSDNRTDQKQLKST